MTLPKTAFSGEEEEADAGPQQLSSTGCGQTGGAGAGQLENTLAGKAAQAEGRLLGGGTGVPP